MCRPPAPRGRHVTFTCAHLPGFGFRLSTALALSRLRASRGERGEDRREECTSHDATADSRAERPPRTCLVSRGLSATGTIENRTTQKHSRFRFRTGLGGLRALMAYALSRLYNRERDYGYTTRKMKRASQKKATNKRTQAHASSSEDFATGTEPPDLLLTSPDFTPCSMLRSRRESRLSTCHTHRARHHSRRRGVKAHHPATRVARVPEERGGIDAPDRGWVAPTGVR